MQKKKKEGGLAAFHIISSWCLNEEISIPRRGAATPNSHWWRTGFHGQNQSISSCSTARDGRALNEPNPPCIFKIQKEKLEELNHMFNTYNYITMLCVCVNQQCLLSNLKYLFLTSDVCFFSTTVKITAVIVPLRTCQYITRSWVVFGWSLVPSYTPSTGTDKTWKKI